MEAFTVLSYMASKQTVFFEDECHWVTKPPNSVIWQREFFEWLIHILKIKSNLSRSMYSPLFSPFYSKEGELIIYIYYAPLCKAERGLGWFI